MNNNERWPTDCVYETVSGHKVELVKVHEGNNHDFPLNGYILGRYRGVPKSQASWKIDGKINEFDSVFCLKKADPALFITPLGTNSVVLSAVPKAFESFASESVTLKNVSYSNSQSLANNLSKVLVKGGVCHELWGRTAQRYEKLKGESAPVVELHYNSSGILFFSCSTISDDDFGEYHVKFNEIESKDKLNEILLKARAIC